MSKWSNFVRGEPARQEVLEVALDWIAQRDGVSIDNYMAKHRDDDDCNELQTYFTTVIDWAASVFKMTDSSMRGIAWNKLYEQYGDKGYDATEMTAEARELLSDSQVQSKKGIYEYLLGGKKETRLLSVRVFTEAVKKRVYKRQTDAAEKNGVSNCSYCALGHEGGQGEDLAAQGYGRRSRRRLVEGRQDRGKQLRAALQVPQPCQR
ncbi:Uncharacterised protein [Corynebacterium imitans]|uniref:Uncharacterized protein n=1 Tax=Corynebacterium imitans TaxID=156978 RepID=A0A239Z2F6_9CORY|nr:MULTISPECIES: HNH endonuclease [Actinomycetes]MDK8274254.1 HNH endonuclease [Varibaculum cambriense]SNV64668.1 Uncharacterised protein [Corynebacterium imitans]